MPSEQTKINGAAEELTDCVRESYKVVATRAVSGQEHNAELVQEFFNGTISNMHTQAEQNRQMAQQLAEQRERQLDAAQALTQESVSAYMEFVDSIFSYWRGAIQAAKNGEKKSK